MNFTPNWSHLAVFGNTHIAKAVVLSPLIAQIVQRAEPLVFKYFGFTQIAWMYWSLMLLALGQLFYTLFCPREIKKYGSDIEKYVIESESVQGIYHFESTNFERIKNLFSVNGGALKFKPITNDEMLKNTEKYVSEVPKEHHELIFYGKTQNEIINEVNSFKECIDPGWVHNDHLNWDLVDIGCSATDILECGSSFDKQLEYEKLRSIFHERRADSWKAEVSRYLYEKKDQSRSWVRVLVACFYALGLIYFVVAAAKNVFGMMQYTWKLV